MATIFKDAYHKMLGHVEVYDEDDKNYLIKVSKRVPKETIIEYEQHIQDVKQIAINVKNARNKYASFGQ